MAQRLTMKVLKEEIDRLAERVDRLEANAGDTGLGDSVEQLAAHVQRIQGERDARIREAAYFRSLERQPGDGSPENDWLAAEQDLDTGFRA